MCVKTDHGNFRFLMSRRHAHYRSYKNPPPVTLTQSFQFEDYTKLGLFDIIKL